MATSNEKYYLLIENLHRLLTEQIEILEDRRDLKSQQIAEMDAELDRQLVEMVRLALIIDSARLTKVVEGD